MSYMKVIERLEKQGQRKRELKEQKEAAAAASLTTNICGKSIDLIENNENNGFNGHSQRKLNEEKDLIWQAKVIKETKSTSNTKTVKNGSNKMLNNQVDTTTVTITQGVNGHVEIKNHCLVNENNLLNESLTTTTTTASNTTKQLQSIAMLPVNHSESATTTVNENHDACTDSGDYKDFKNKKVRI